MVRSQKNLSVGAEEDKGRPRDIPTLRRGETSKENERVLGIKTREYGVL